jgi:hypothetical protein
MDEITIPIPKTSLEKLLKPINRATESCVLKTDENTLYTVCSSQDRSVILYASCDLPVEIEPIKLNLISIKKFLNGLNCLGDDGEFSMILNKNYIRCQSKSDSDSDNSYFKYHLVDDGIISESTVNKNYFSKLKFETEFEIPISKIKQIASAYTFTTDVNKIYFYTKNDMIYADVDDKTLQNIDNISFSVSEKYTGEKLERPLALKMEVFKNLISSKLPVRVRIDNRIGVIVFITKEDHDIELKYIVSALVK